MKIAIHHREKSFSDRWITYCEANKLDYVIVDSFDNTIIEKIQSLGITHFLWHFHHASVNDILVSNYVMNAIENIGIKTFPNKNTRWHFEDKVAQKYLFESLHLPHAKSYVFYDKIDALKFVEKTTFPIVSKLKRGAGATNVKLITTKEEAKENIELMFSKGVNPGGTVLTGVDQKIRLAKKIKNPIHLAKKVYSFIIKHKREKQIANKECGYVYFQEFMPKNDFDTRIIVIGNMTFGMRRFNRTNDFRASGSGKIDYNCAAIDIEIVKLAQEASAKIGAQCLAFDFVYNAEKKPVIIEVCYAFSINAYDFCEGYWDKNLTFHKVAFNPQHQMIKELLCQ